MIRFGIGNGHSCEFSIKMFFDSNSDRNKYNVKTFQVN